MSAADVPMRYRRLRAPRADGTKLVDPPLSHAEKLVAANQQLAAGWDAASGLPFSQWRAMARRVLVAADATGPLILSGHQPTLFHPGVWFKNFLLDRIARQVGGRGINLIIDNDTIRSASIRVPTGSSAAPRLVEVPIDAPTDEVPLEERRLLDPALFRSFGERVREAFRPHRQGRDEALLIDGLWRHARRIVTQEMEAPPAGEPDDRPPSVARLLLGDCLAEARHRLERELGLETQERSLRSFCSGWPFANFIGELLRRWRELHPLYNAALAEYRVVNHIRSQRQPAPELAADDEWLEVPLWIWTAESPRRRRAFVRQVQNGWELTDRAGVLLRSQSANSAADETLVWNTTDFRADVKVRPRALITTMYARLVLSDLFIHGIGGAKYDELTDALIRRFFGIEPPAYMTATATFHLPIDRPHVSQEDVRQIERRIRDTVHHPESFLGEVPGNRGAELRSLAEEKQQLVAARWQSNQKRDWHQRVTSCNERMSALLANVRQELLARRQKLLAELHAAELLGSREFSFCLFPAETLPRQLLDLCAAHA